MYFFNRGELQKDAKNQNFENSKLGVTLITLNYFLTGCVDPEVWNTYPYLRIFLTQEMADLIFFFNFHKLEPISILRGFYLKNGWFTIFVKWETHLRIFLPNGTHVYGFFFVKN